MQVCLNDIWNRTIANKSRGVRTWVYIDELYVLTQSENCARFLLYIFKQIRKYGGAPTGITQNVEDLLSNRESRGILNNCDFILMLNQSSEDRAGDRRHVTYFRSPAELHQKCRIRPWTDLYRPRHCSVY